MRWLKLSRCSVLAICCLSVVQGCAAVTGVHVAGRVLDRDSGKPVAGAYVYGESGRDEACPIELGGCHCVVLSVQVVRTDENGYYSFPQNFRFGVLPTSKFGSIKVYKKGYINAPPPKSSDWRYSAGYLVSQWFYGTGTYQDNFERYPLTQGSNTYYLSKREVKSLRRAPDHVTPRIYYLHFISSQLGPCVGYEGSAVSILFPVRRAIYEEAASLAKTKEDNELVDEICRQARGQIDDDKPCHIEDGPAR